MEPQQIMEILLSMQEKVDAHQSKADARLEEIMADWKAWNEELRASRKETATVIGWKSKTEEGTMACQDMEARPEEKEPTSVDMNPEAAEQREVPVEDAEVMPVGKPKKKWCRDRKLAAERCCQKPKTSTWENCGPPKELADKKMSRRTTVARRTRDIRVPNMPQRVKVAQCRGHIIGNNQTRNNIARGAPRGQRFQVKTEGGIGMKNE
jgi:hypothetical protein